MSRTKLPVALAMLVAAVTSARAESLVFRGDEFVRKYESGNDKARLVEFIPPSENLQNWTKLIGYRAVFDSRQTRRLRRSAVWPRSVTAAQSPGC